MSDTTSYETLKVTRDGHVVHVQLNRPKAGNAMNRLFWDEYKNCFQQIAKDRDCRAVVVSAAGKFFSVGLDIKDPNMIGGMGDEEKDVARKFFAQREELASLQETFTAMERCPQPVIIACHGAAIGGAIDLMCAADIRLCSKNAWFCIKEVDIGLCADVGTLQRLHHCMGNQSLARDLAYTARRMDASEALSAGFVSAVHETDEGLMKHALDMARTIASKTPVAIAGTKHHLNYSRENKVSDSLNYMAAWNGAALQTGDIKKAALASITKSGQPEFSKL